MRRDHDADPELAADAPDEVEHLAAAEWVEAGGRLVEKRDHRIVDERLREHHAGFIPVEYVPICRYRSSNRPTWRSTSDALSLAAVGGRPLIWAM